MWYFVECTGRVKAKAKTQPEIFSKWADLVARGYEPDTLDVVDQYGHQV